MSSVNQVIRELQGRRNQAEKEVDKLGLAIKALEQLSGMQEAGTQPRGRRTMSAAAKRKIAMAMRARWARQKGVAKPARKKRKLSAAGRARIIAAVKARWAKAKAQKQ